MRYHLIGGTIIFGIVFSGLIPVRSAEEPASDSQMVQALQTLLTDGLIRRASLDQISRTVRQARSSQPDDPVLDYAHGLVLLGRVQPKQAIPCFEAALKRQPTYLPAWQALLRTRLIRKDVKSLQTESLRLAQLARNNEVNWPDESQRRQAAAWLGKIAGYLSLPEVDLLKDDERIRFESDIKDQLGNPLDSAFAAGRQTLREDYELVRHSVKVDIQRETDLKEKKADDDLAELKDKGESLTQKTETLQLTAQQWKDWLDQSTKKSDQQLQTLEAEYKTLAQAAQGVSRLIQQNQLDVGRMQTQLSVQGIRGTRADQSPAMIQLRGEFEKLQTQFQLLERRGANVMTQGRQVLAARAIAVKRYQQATGNIVRQTDAINRWKKNVEENANQIGKQSHAKTAPGLSLEKRLSLPASYFELDEKTELTRLIEEAGGTPATP